MSIEKMGNMDSGVNVHYRLVPQKQPKAPDNDDTAPFGEPGSRTKVSCPPFLPVGDTQSIYKK